MENLLVRLSLGRPIAEIERLVFKFNVLLEVSLATQNATSKNLVYWLFGERFCWL
jgi:hypothetical protein